jgi:hypothetical protein
MVLVAVGFCVVVALYALYGVTRMSARSRRAGTDE